MKVSRRCSSGGAGSDLEQLAALVGDKLLGMITARPALEFAAERAIGAVSTRATAPGGGPNLALANRIARTDDHAALYR